MQDLSDARTMAVEQASLDGGVRVSGETALGRYNCSDVEGKSTDAYTVDSANCLRGHHGRPLQAFLKRGAPTV